MKRLLLIGLSLLLVDPSLATIFATIPRQTVSPRGRVVSTSVPASSFPESLRVTADFDSLRMTDPAVDYEIGAEYSTDGEKTWNLLVSVGYDAGNVVRDLAANVGKVGPVGATYIIANSNDVAELRRINAVIRIFVLVNPTKTDDLVPKGDVQIGAFVEDVPSLNILARGPDEHHSVAADASGGSSGGAATTASYSHTCTGSDRALYAAISLDGAGTPAATATYNSVSMTKKAEIAGQQGLSFFRLAAPATGANTVTINWTGSFVWASASESFTGVDQTTIDTAASTTEAATGTAVTKNVSSASGDMTIDALSLNAGTTAGSTPDAGQSSSEQGAAAAATMCGISWEVGAATVAMGWSWTTGTNRNAHSAFNILQSVTASTKGASKSRRMERYE